MGWLLGPTLASLVLSFVAVKIFDYISAGAASGLVSSARGGLFVLTGTAVIAKAGMSGFTKRVRQLRQGFIKHTPL